MIVVGFKNVTFAANNFLQKLKLTEHIKNAHVQRRSNNLSCRNYEITNDKYPFLFNMQVTLKLFSTFSI